MLHVHLKKRESGPYQSSPMLQRSTLPCLICFQCPFVKHPWNVHHYNLVLLGWFDNVCILCWVWSHEARNNQWSQPGDCYDLIHPVIGLFWLRPLTLWNLSCLQLLPRFCMDILSHAPGVPGLFVASLFSGALSSVSSMLNSLGAVTWQDFCQLSKCFQDIPDFKATLINKGLCEISLEVSFSSHWTSWSFSFPFWSPAVIYAAAGIGMAFVFSNIGGTLLQVWLLLWHKVSGDLPCDHPARSRCLLPSMAQLGHHLLASLCWERSSHGPTGLFVRLVISPISPNISQVISNMNYASTQGATVGGIVGFAIPMWISIGAYVTSPDVTIPMNFRWLQATLEPSNSKTYSLKHLSEGYQLLWTVLQVVLYLIPQRHSLPLILGWQLNHLRLQYQKIMTTLRE